LAKDDLTIWVAILRADGILIPFSLYENKKWTTPWPEAKDERKVELKSLNDIPNSWLGKKRSIPQTWYLLPSKGSVSEIKVSRPIAYSTHCVGNWGLLTDYPPKHYRYSPYPKIGMALSSKNIAIPMTELRPTSSEKKELLSFVTGEFIQLEKEAISKRAQEEGILENRLRYEGHPVFETERNKTEIILGTVYRTYLAKNGQYIYYLEAKREYKKPETFDDRECSGITFFKGFLKKENGNFSFLDRDLVITDCDWKYVNTVIPFGIVEVDNKNVIVVQKNYYEAESYHVLELGSSNLREIISLHGGGC
jgi:hypothetical protein